MTPLVEDSPAQPKENRVFVKDLEYDYFSNSTCGDFHMKDKKSKITDHLFSTLIGKCFDYFLLKNTFFFMCPIFVDS